jgi:hypothetical protein
MSKDFDPDQFLNATEPVAQEQKRIEEENARRGVATQPGVPQMNPSGPANEPYRPSISEAPGQWAVNNVVAPAYGVAAAGADFAAQHPTAAALGADLALAALPQSNIPVLKQAQQLAKAPFNLAQSALGSADAYTASRNAQALAQMEHQVRQYGKMGQAVPQQLQQAVDALRSRVGGPVAPAAAPAPAAPAPAAPAAVNPAAAEASQISKANQIVRNLALDKLLKGGAVAGLATYSGGLNTNEQEELARRRAREVEQARQMGWIK